METIKNAREYEQELTRIFNRFNKHYWNNELPEVIITFTGTKGAHGHMTNEPVWVSSKSDKKYELNISAYTIDRSPEDICETLLHEQCHLYNQLHDITDTSNMGRYHNTKFKKTASEHGLVVERDTHYGWALTSLSTEAKAYVKKLNIKRFEYKRIQPKRSNTLIRYGCPNCTETFAFVSSEKNLLCGICLSKLVPMSSKRT